MGFGDVLADLAKIGYDAEWQCIPAAAIGALHKRDRVYIVAYPNGSCTTNGRQREVVQSKNKSRGNDRNRGKRNVGQISLGRSRQSAKVVADTDNARGRTPTSGIDSNGPSQIQKRQNIPQFVFGRRGANDFSQWWETEPNVGRVANGISNRVDRLRGLGNAVVPQVAELVGRLIGEHAKQLK